MSSAYERDKHAAQLEDADDNRRDLARERERGPATASSRPQECWKCRRDRPCDYGLMTCDERISLYDAGRTDLARELLRWLPQSSERDGASPNCVQSVRAVLLAAAAEQGADDAQ